MEYLMVTSGAVVPSCMIKLSGCQVVCTNLCGADCSNFCGIRCAPVCPVQVVPMNG